ncbi:hypothetical protein [Marinitoga aeolica]|uniref:Uncharacterized protein n=1 Tax=Marinitoga aeolica TaxID=2809031 RepID=A0ABY8PQV9_9BACT|nr:hypothetical protein [Marinitoga aeolica]WGS64913.1 hypothetical protein JRV97_11240 [Marinitoga aeolica]
MKQKIEIKQPLINPYLKHLVKDSQIILSCEYAGCGSDDSWPKFTT